MGVKLYGIFFSFLLFFSPNFFNFNFFLSLHCMEMVENRFKEMVFFHCRPWSPQELITASAICFEFWTYNHGQKSWDTFAFLGRFPIHTGPTPSLTSKTVLHACIQNFFRVSTLYWVGGGRTASMHCFKRKPRNDRKIWIFQYCPKDFSPGL